jgi:hypothetical protein
VSQPQQVVAGGAARLQGGGVQHRADVAERAPQPGVGLAADERAALVGRIQAEDDPHSGGFPGTVWSHEPGDLTWLDDERHAIQGERGAEPLAQAGDCDSCFHTGTVRTR